MYIYLRAVIKEILNYLFSLTCHVKKKINIKLLEWILLYRLILNFLYILPKYRCENLKSGLTIMFIHSCNPIRLKEILSNNNIHVDLFMWHILYKQQCTNDKSSGK